MSPTIRFSGSTVEVGSLDGLRWPEACVVCGDPVLGRTVALPALDDVRVPVCTPCDRAIARAGKMTVAGCFPMGALLVSVTAIGGWQLARLWHWLGAFAAALVAGILGALALGRAWEVLVRLVHGRRVRGRSLGVLRTGSLIEVTGEAGGHRLSFKTPEAAEAFCQANSGRLSTPTTAGTGTASLSALVSDLRDETKKTHAALELARLGKAAVPAVVGVLRSSAEPVAVRSNAAWILGKMDDFAGLGAVPDLAEVAASSGEAAELRKMALYSLGKMGIGALGAAPALERILQDEASRDLHLSARATLRGLRGGMG